MTQIQSTPFAAQDKPIVAIILDDSSCLYIHTRSFHAHLRSQSNLEPVSDKPFVFEIFSPQGESTTRGHDTLAAALDDLHRSLTELLAGRTIRAQQNG